MGAEMLAVILGILAISLIWVWAHSRYIKGYAAGCKDKGQEIIGLCQGCGYRQRVCHLNRMPYASKAWREIRQKYLSDADSRAKAAAATSKLNGYHADTVCFDEFASAIDREYQATKEGGNNDGDQSH